MIGSRRCGRGLATAAAPLALALLWAAPAGASTATVSAQTLGFTAAAGETNVLTVALEGGAYTITDTGSVIIAGAGCAAVNANKVSCPTADIDGITVDLDNLDDQATIADSVVVPGFNGADIFGGSGADTLKGGAETYSEMFGEAGTDTLTAGANGDRLDGGTEADVLTGGPGGDSFEGGDGDDIQSGGGGFDYFATASAPDGKDTIDGGPDIDAISYSPRIKSLSLDSDGVADDGEGCPGPGCEADDIKPTVEAIEAGRGDDVISGSGSANTLDGNDGDDIISSGGGADVLRGDDGDDTLSGDAGNDYLSASRGADRMLGGTGDDLLEDDTTDGDADVFSGGGGTDTANYRFTEFPLRIDLDGKPDDGVSSPLVGGQKDNVKADMENVTGGELADVIVGNGAANELIGEGGSDRLLGGKGPDGLFGGDGGDRLTGGKGRDLIEGDSGADAITSRDGTPDEVSCGSSLDRVKADRADHTGADCDKVSR